MWSLNDTLLAFQEVAGTRGKCCFLAFLQPRADGEELATDRASLMSYAPASGHGHFGRATCLLRLYESNGR